MNMSNMTTQSSSESQATTLLPIIPRAVAFSCYLITGTVGLFLYSLIFIVVIRFRAEKFKAAYYTFLLNLGVGECFNTFYYAFLGSTCTLTGQCIPLAPNRVIDSLTWVVWYLEFFVHPIIACDRLVAVCFYQHYERVFSPRLSALYAAIAWICAVIFAMPLLIWFTPVAFHPDQLSDGFDTTAAVATVVSNDQFYVEMALLCVCATFYGIAIAKIWHRRRKIVSKGQAANQNIQRAQRNLLVQGLLHFSYLLICILMWNFILGGIADVWLNFAVVMMTQMITINTCVLTLGLNSGVRESVKEFVFRRGGVRAQLQQANFTVNTQFQRTVSQRLTRQGDVADDLPMVEV